MARTYVFDPVGMDLFSPTARQPQPGSLVRKVQPHGCPKNGTMGHCYIAPVDGSEKDFCLVLESSLRRVNACV
jgi:hypothetical protein